MQIIPRAQLAAALTGPLFAPDGDRQEEMAAFAAAIEGDAPPTVTHFVFTDHENGDDPEVGWPEHAQINRRTLVPLTYAATGDYYGVDVHSVDISDRDDRRVYHCYLGGSQLSSAPGFVISTAVMVTE